VGSASVRRAIELLNRERTSRGLRALSVDAGLCLAAQRQSDNMALNGFFGHIGSDGSSVQERIVAFVGPVSACTEAIAAGLLGPAGVVDAWLSNASAREQILSARYTAVGVGCTYSPEGAPRHYWTVTLAIPRASDRAAADISSRSARPLPQWGTALDTLLRLPLFGLCPVK
ncbi:MAG: CAP domain-containing protein, partial [Anaerolineae bacterium]